MVLNMKRFENKETYEDEFGLTRTTYEINRKETTNLKIGMITEKVYFNFGNGFEYAGCRDINQYEAIRHIEENIFTGHYKKVTA